jgi:hypothetical protein
MWGWSTKGNFFYLHPGPAKSFLEFVGVYDHADHTRSPVFLQELEEVTSRTQYPVLVAGDFNLIRGIADKNNRNID